MNTTTVTEFLDRFFAETKFDINLRAVKIGRKGADSVFTRSSIEIAEFADEHADLELYFGCATRDGGGEKEYCREVAALWCDLDFKDLPEADARTKLAAFDPQPSIVINSGGGLHCYWLLRTPAVAADVERMLKGLAKALGADTSCAEIARVLRIPGSFNHKPTYPTPREVHIEQACWERRYDLTRFTQFEALAPQPSAAIPLEGKIPPAGQHEALLSFAGTVRNRGLDEAGIFKCLKAFSEARCEPPVEEAKLHNIAEAVAAIYEAGAEIRVIDPQAIELPDMPDTALTGRLGEIYQTRMKDFPIALAWPALLTGAGALIRVNESPLRANLFTALVGDVNCGKSSAIERANFLLDMKPDVLLRMKSGSGEGLLLNIGDQHGDPRLLFPDELQHTLEKAQIENAQFASILNSLFYHSEETLTIARGKMVQFNCQLSLIGGIVTEKFDDCFGSAATAGTYSRFLFGQSPTGFQYAWRPNEGAPEIVDTFDAVQVDRDVWAARDDIIKTEGLNPRVLEIALRCAAICAAIDGRQALRAADLAPAWELARYETRVRMWLQPNPGKNLEAQVAHKLLNYLGRHAPGGEFVAVRKALKSIHGYEYGPSVVERAVNAMRFGGVVETREELSGKTKQRRRYIRLCVEGAKGVTGSSL
jgi:DNA primase RepB-like protein